jgi:hypothetical protein
MARTAEKRRKMTKEGNMISIMEYRAMEQLIILIMNESQP